MRMDESIKKKPLHRLSLTPAMLLAAGIVFVVLALLMAGLTGWEAFGRQLRIAQVTAPGFQDLELPEAGRYVGVYRHTGGGAPPFEALTHLDVRVMSAGDDVEVPVLMNSTGQTFDRFGVKGMPLFEFEAPAAGRYTVSSVYANQTQGPTVNVLIIPQAAGNIKQTLIVGVTFVGLFLVAGVLIIVKRNAWTPLLNEA